MSISIYASAIALYTYFADIFIDALFRASPLFAAAP